MHLKKIFCALVCFTLLTAPIYAIENETGDAQTQKENSPTVADYLCAGATAAPSLYAPYAALICADNGQILVGKSMETPVPPASITKLLTALVVFENCTDLAEPITVSSEAIHAIEPGSTHIALQEGETVTVEQMLGAMLVQSANDASNVLAEHIGGTMEHFAEMMNEKAAALGCANTNFANANGLDHDEHYTSAHDMALIAQQLVAYPAFTEIAGAQTYTMPPNNIQSESRTFWTKQNTLNPNSKFYYEGAFAGKNGWTSKAHHTLVTYAKRDNITLIAVVMAGTSKYNCLTDTVALFDYGFSQFHTYTLSEDAQASVAKEAVGEQVNATTLKDTVLLLPNNIMDTDITVTCNQDDVSPVLEVQVAHDNTKPLLTIPLKMQLVQEAVNIESEAEKESTGGRWLNWVLPVIFAGIAVMGVFLLLCCIYRYNRIRKQRKKIHEQHMRERRRREQEQDDGVDIDGPWPWEDIGIE